MKIMNVKTKMNEMKAAKVAKQEANRIAINRRTDEYEIVEVLGKKYAVYNLTITIGEEDVTDFMPGHTHGDVTQVSAKLKEARKFWSQHEKRFRFNEII